MDPKQENEEIKREEEKQKPGEIGQGINTINKLARGGLKNPLGKIGSRVVAQTALRGFAAFLAGPGLPIAIAIVLVFILTFIIVGFGGAPSAPASEPNAQETNQNPTTTQTATPTETIITPTLAVP